MFGYFAFKKTRDIDVNEALADEYIIEESVQDTDDNTILAQAMFFEVDEDLNPVKEVYPEVVLSATDSDSTCKSGAITYSSSSVCYTSSSSGSADVDITQTSKVGVGDLIKTDDFKLTLTNIEVPPLFSGSPTMDSNVRQIYKDDEGDYHWTLKPAGEMINRNVVEGNTYAGDNQTKEFLDVGDSYQTVSYGVEYSVEVSGEANGGGENSLTISQYYENDCMDDCENSANPTPQKYLMSSEILAKSNQYAGYYESLLEEEDTQQIEVCDENTEFITMNISGTSPIACTPSLKELWISFKKKISNLFDAEYCSPEDEENGSCISTASIVVIMESPWGSKDDCAKDGQCVNEFNDLRNGNYRVAGDGGHGDVYVLTDCTAEISGVGPVDLQCAWDISYISEELEFQSVDNIPGEDYPDKEDYINFHINESENRTTTPLSM